MAGHSSRIARREMDMTSDPEHPGQTAPRPLGDMLYGDEVLNAGWTSIPRAEDAAADSGNPVHSEDLPSDAEIADFLERLYASQA
jgi:hypothetical protein